MYLWLVSCDGGRGLDLAHVGPGGVVVGRDEDDEGAVGDLLRVRRVGEGREAELVPGAMGL